VVLGNPDGVKTELLHEFGLVHAIVDSLGIAAGIQGHGIEEMAEPHLISFLST
jgi:hypothetical protein